MSQTVYPVFSQDENYQVALSRLADRINEVHKTVGGTIEHFTDPQVTGVSTNGHNEFLASSMVLIRQSSQPTFNSRLPQ